MKIGIVLPTRGLVFTQVEEVIESWRDDYNIKVYRSHDLPIPEGHNKLTQKALEDGSDYILFVEEDTVAPARALDNLVQANKSIACVDYGVSGWSCITRDTNGKILWCGLGCTLVKREVFEQMDVPYFRIDQVLDLVNWKWRTLPEEYLKNKGYGGQDIWFFCKAREKGFEITQVEGECDHLKLGELGRNEFNKGLHTIVLKPRIEKNQVIEGR